MAGVNKAIILGNVGKDPEIRSLSSGDELATFSIATSETWRDKNSGERKEKTEWHNVTVWGENLVRVVRDYVRKGDKIYVEGKIETRKWQDQSGQDRYSTGITVKGFDGKIQLLGERRNGNNAGSASSRRLQDREPGDEDSGGRPISGRDSDLDDEVPF